MWLSKLFPKSVGDFNFSPFIKTESNPRVRTRLLALHNLKEGKKVAEICEYLQVSRGRVREWAQNFLAHGIEGVRDRPGRGRKPMLSFEEKISVSKLIEERSYSDEGGRLFAEDVNKFVFHNFGKKMSRSLTYNLMHELGFSWITSRSVHPKSKNEDQDEFKKNFNDRGIVSARKYKPQRNRCMVPR